MKALYPLKFKPIAKYRIWGGNKLNDSLPEEERIENLGEIWSISAVEGDESIVESGALKGQNLKELIRTYREKLLGKDIWDKFGEDFPLLIKFIDAAQPLSIQVHPDDEVAKDLHDSFGKTEMWYIIEAKKDSELIIGFKEGADRETYLKHLKDGNLEEIMQSVSVTGGDAVFIPAGRVHAIGAGIVLAEIQQTSDITYRIYDYNRKDKDGQQRELHTDLALGTIDFNPVKETKVNYKSTENQFSSLIDSPYFRTRIYKGENKIEISDNREMVIYICSEGKVEFVTDDSVTELNKFESLLIPAEVSDFEIKPLGKAVLIEVRV